MLIVHELSGGELINRLIVDGNDVKGTISDFVLNQKRSLSESTWENFFSYYAGCKANVLTVGAGNGIRIFLSEEAERKAEDPTPVKPARAKKEAAIAQE